MAKGARLRTIRRRAALIAVKEQSARSLARRFRRSGSWDSAPAPGHATVASRKSRSRYNRRLVTVGPKKSGR